jgi:rRNA maturation RNase YbeY
MTIKGHWEFESNELKKALPLSPKQCEILLAKIEKSLRALPAWRQSEKILGYRLRHLGILVCSEASIRRFQREFRGMKRSTDVLSFPAREAPLGQEKGYLGDLVISLPNVLRNAKRYKCTAAEEFLRVWIHSILHLIGFDHIGVSAKKAQQMLKLQEDFVEKLRPLVYKRPHERKAARNRKPT